MLPQFVWSAEPEGAVAEAIRMFNLKQIGWMGFDNIPWVRELKMQFPQVEEIALYCSSISGAKLKEVDVLFRGAEASARSALRAYFVAKLALEKLSCMRSGAGAGLCDKYSAYLQIFEQTKVFAT